jgi:hypothetical protein
MPTIVGKPIPSNYSGISEGNQIKKIDFLENQKLCITYSDDSKSDGFLWEISIYYTERISVQDDDGLSFRQV